MIGSREVRRAFQVRGHLRLAGSEGSHEVKTALLAALLKGLSGAERYMWGLGGEGAAECGEWQSFHLGEPRPGAFSFFFASGFKSLMICASE